MMPEFGFAKVEHLTSATYLHEKIARRALQLRSG